MILLIVLKKEIEMYKKKIIIKKIIREVYVVTWTNNENIESRVFGEEYRGRQLVNTLISLGFKDAKMSLGIVE